MNEEEYTIEPAPKPVEIDEPTLHKALKQLEKGESVVINGVTYLNPPVPTAICDVHEFEDVGDEGNGYRAAKCLNCINGRIFDPKTHQVKDGEIRPLR